MERRVSKSRFKARALEYFRQVEQTRKEVIVTDHGRPVVRITPFVADSSATLRELRGSILRYDEPTEPVGREDWEALG